MQHHPPVAQLVAETFDHQGGVAGHLTGRVALVFYQRDEVGGGAFIEADVAQSLKCRGGIAR